MTDSDQHNKTGIKGKQGTGVKTLANSLGKCVAPPTRE